MIIRAVTILALCATQFHPSFAFRNFNVAKFSKEHPADRLLTLMRNLYTTGETRVRQLQYQRTLYESTLEFEMGYVMGEIVERMRQLITHVKMAIKFKNYNVYDKLIRLEFVQKLYFELYHLVMMMNELPRKYGDRPEELTSGIEGAKNDNNTLLEAMADLPAREKEREREKMLKIRDLQANQASMELTGILQGSTTKPKSRFWPIEYGWSIENW